jgi:tetratricopeptide (TPR) repeat protein
MSVAREDVLLLYRALRRGWTDARGIRKALERHARKPISLAEALPISADRAAALSAEAALPDPAADRALLEVLRAALLASGEESAAEWERFAATLARPSRRHGHAALPVPREFGDLTLKWELARRERGVVYRAVRADGREAAVKVFRPSEPADPSLPRVSGLAYAVAPFEEGDSLEAKRPSARRGAEAVLRAAELLRGRPHGALTPARILLRRDDSVALIGREWATALPPSPRTLAYSEGNDVRALGAILYEILVGVPPAGDASPRERAAEVDPGLDQVTAAALGGGYADTGAFAEDLGRALRGQAPTGRRAAAASPAGAGRRLRPWVLAASVALAAGLGGYALRPGAPAAVPEAVRAPAAPSAAPVPPAPAPVSDAPRPVLPPLTAAEDEALLRVCLSALERGERERVLLVAGEAASRGSVREWPYYQTAAAHLAKGDLDAALHRVNQALGLFPDSRDALELRAEAHALRGDVARTTDDLDRLHRRKASELNAEILKLGRRLQEDPADAASRLLRGVYYQLKRNHESAALDFSGAIDGGLRRALLWRAHAFRGAENLPQAREDATRFLEEFPAGPSATEARELLRELGS